MIFQCHSVLYLWRKQSDQNGKNGQNDFFFKFLLKIRNLHQKLHIPVNFHKNRVFQSLTDIYR
jgi:hypothetical protein